MQLYHTAHCPRMPKVPKVLKVSKSPYRQSMMQIHPIAHEFQIHMLPKAILPLFSTVHTFGYAFGETSD